MVRRLVFYFEIALLGALQIFWLACAVLGLLQAAVAAGPVSQHAMPRSINATHAEFGNFLKSLPGGAELHHAAKIVALERPITDDPTRFIAHRFYRHKAVDRTLPKIRHGFETECRAHGGVAIETAEDLIVFRRMLRAEKSGVGLGEQFTVTTCRDAAHSILAAKVVITARSIGIYNRTGVYIMTGAVATPAYAAALAAIAADKASSERRDAEYRLAAERQAKRNEEANKRLAQWQQALAVGDATHCGFVITLRGPMVHVTFRSRAAWVRRETLAPRDENKRCTAYD